MYKINSFKYWYYTIKHIFDDLRQTGQENHYLALTDGIIVTSLS